LLDLLAFLSAEQLPMAVATSTKREPALFCLRHGGLEQYFTVIVTGDEVVRGKPAPDIYLEAARRLQVEPSACVALEDSEAGILAVSRAGMRGLLIPDWIRPSPAAIDAAFLVVESLREAIGVFAELAADRRARPFVGLDR
jgi:beta-phosphoglucomutase-like phosphatase (HAD superfamily)